MTKKEFAPVTPGEMLKEEFLTEEGRIPYRIRVIAESVGKSHRHLA